MSAVLEKSHSFTKKTTPAPTPIQTGLLREATNVTNTVSIARLLVGEALEVLWNAGANSDADDIWGAYNLTRWLDDQLKESESNDDPDLGVLCSNTVTVIAVLVSVNISHECILMRAAHTILKVVEETLTGTDTSKSRKVRDALHAH